MAVRKSDLDGGMTTELKYSEQDMADIRLRWEQAEKERTFSVELAALRGQVTQLPSQMEQIAKRVVTEAFATQDSKSAALAADLAKKRWSIASATSVVIQTATGILVAWIAYMSYVGKFHP